MAECNGGRFAFCACYLLISPVQQQHVQKRYICCTIINYKLNITGIIF